MREEATTRKNVRRLYILAGLTLVLSVAEVLGGAYANSLALITDSFHQLSDVLSLYIAAVAAKYAVKKKRWNGPRDVNLHSLDPTLLLYAYYAAFYSGSGGRGFTFGFARAETIGALVNACFLVSICLFAAFEALQRFIEVPDVDHVDELIFVAIGSCAVNLFGVFLFHGGHGHGHSHGGHAHGHSHGGHGHGHGHSHGHGGHARGKELHDDADVETPLLVNGSASAGEPARDDNIYSVYLHVLGDFLGALTALASGLCIKYSSSPARFYADPIATMLIVIFLLFSSIPVVRRTVKVLMNVAPQHVDIGLLRQRLGAVRGVTNIHELHVWELVDAVNIATVHFICRPTEDITRITREFRSILHEFGVHSSTIQPEFLYAAGEIGAEVLSSHDSSDSSFYRSASEMDGGLPCLEHCTPACDSEDVCCDAHATQEARDRRTLIVHSSRFSRSTSVQ